jgi:hypothetical protein
MRAILNARNTVRLYYGIGLLMGGFRHYSFELDLFSYRISELYPLLTSSVFIAERTLLVLFLLALFKPESKWVHFAAYAMLLLMDTFFNNCVAFQNSLVISHQFPLLCGLVLHFSGSDRGQQRTLQAFLHLIGAGFIISGISKIATGWLDPSESVTYGYLIQFNHGYGVNYYLSDLFVGIDSLAFWKLTDYAVVLFELAFAVNLVSFRYYRKLFVAAVVFHALILAILNIGIFYPQIIMYILILQVDTGDRTLFSDRKPMSLWLFGGSVTALLIAWYIYRVSPFVVAASPNWVYDHIETVINLTLMLIFVITIFGTSHRNSLIESETHDQA